MPPLLASTTPTPTPTGTSTTSPLETAQQRCESGSALCGWVTDVTGSRGVGRTVEFLVGTPLRIAVILLIGYLVRFVLHRVVDRTAEKVAEGRAGLGRLDERLSSATALLAASPLASARRAQRARTLASVLKSIVTGVIGVVLLLMVLGELGYNIAPLIASAGIAGVALGFGAQTLVKDFLSGIFMLLEDQYGVGDVVDLGEAAGSVEAVGLRVTRLRDVEGTVWYVRNGEVLRVGNKSQGWARAVLDLLIAYSEDVERVKAIMLDVAQGLRSEQQWAPMLLEEPEVWGIEAMQPDGVVVRLVVKTQPLQQWEVARELRSRLQARFDAEGVEIPLPQRMLWMRPEPAAPGAAGQDPAQG